MPFVSALFETQEMLHLLFNWPYSKRAQQIKLQTYAFNVGRIQMDKICIVIYKWWNAYLKKTNVVTFYNNQVVEALNKWKKCFAWD